MTIEIETGIPMPNVSPAPQRPVQQGAPRQSMRIDDDRSIRAPMRAPDGLQRQRRSFIDPFEVPQIVRDRYAEAGWSFEWKRHTVFGQGDASYDTALAENHWESVTSDEIPGFMPKGYTGVIIRDGLILMKRPTYLTEEAKQDDIRSARDMVWSKEAQLGQAPPGTMPREHPDLKPRVGKSFEPIEVPQD